MGYNTVIVLFNDHDNLWPTEIRYATRAWRRFDIRRPTYNKCYFGYGEVISREYADLRQVCVVSQNSGSYLTCLDPVEQKSDLKALADVLRGHGYSVKRPDSERFEGPSPWGWWARQQRENKA